ncbi:MAG TPA: glycosyltransferase family 2 protein [Burkholderiales bacterium]
MNAPHTAPLTDPQVKLLIPADDVESPELTILVPAMNEQLTIGRFLEWCHEGIRMAGCRAEILIVDSSSDQTPQIAQAAGARVLCTPKRGLGRAYIDAMPYVRGQYIVMGDADCTYDFRQVGLFLEQMRAGHGFVMGSRFKGTIEDGAMPALHRYFGTPLTTFILNFMFGSHFSDIHCGMRGISRDALMRMQLQSQSWEYASEMVLKSVHMNLGIAEVPINFFKDQEGRLSHMKRGGWLEPWRAGWQNLRAMFVYGADFFLAKPGLLALVLGLLLIVPLVFGPMRVGALELSLNWMLLGTTLATVGLGFCYAGALARLLFDYDAAQRRKLEYWFPYDRTMVIVGLMLLAAICLALPLAVSYVRADYVLPSTAIAVVYPAVAGLWLTIAAAQTFTFLLLSKAVPLMIQPNVRPMRALP